MPTIATIAVAGTASPWSFAGGLNAAYPFGNSSGTAAAVALTGLIAGMTIYITSTAGTVDCNTGAGAKNADGDPLTITGDTQAPTYYPTHYTTAKTLGRGGLIGAFVDDTGALIQAVSLGTGAFTLVVPAGATKLQFGVNDNVLSDNSGSFTVSYYAPIIVIPSPARLPIVFTSNFSGAGTSSNTTGSGQIFPIGIT